MKSCWKLNNLGAYECKLGTLNKAIVLVRSQRDFHSSLWWRISISSYLPFTEIQYNKEFNNPEECAIFAEGIVMEWLNSLTEAQQPIIEKK